MERPDLSSYLQKENAVRVVLALDLGNSRTAMAVVDQVGEQDGQKVAIHDAIPLIWDLEGIPESVKKASGPYPSIVSCSVQNDKHSFVRIGAHSRFNNRCLASALGEKSISSPKRYFFDSGKTKRGWVASKVPGEKWADIKAKELDGELAQAISRRYGFDNAVDLPKAGLLGGMIIELYSQAHCYVNSEEFKKQTDDRRSRFISHVHLTCPTTFSKDECARYVLQCEKALRIFAELECEKWPWIKVICHADEASAVLGYYVDVEIGRAGGNVPTWLATTGRLCPVGGYKMRVAVIDIGGGTTDLTIADISRGETIDEANITRLFLDGVNCAGDDFLAELIQVWLFPKVMLALKAKTGTIFPDAKTLKERYNTFVVDNKAIIGTWVSLALRFLAQLNRRSGDSNKIKICDGVDDRLNLSKLVLALLQKTEKEFETSELLELEIAIEKKDVDEIDECLANVLYPVLNEMGRKIIAFDCDCLIVSGKIAELNCVRRLVRENIPLPPWAVIEIVDLMKPGTDVKMATVLGGAYAALRELRIGNAVCRVRFQSGGDMRSDYDWGYTTADINAGNLRISEAWGTKLTVNDGETNIKYTGADVYLLRQMAGGIGTVSVTHVIRRNDSHLQMQDGVELKIAINACGVKLLNVQGETCDGIPLVIDQFECVQHGCTGGRHWMDEGTVR